MDLVTFATRVCVLLEVKTMIGATLVKARPPSHADNATVTNAAGGLNPDYNVGDIVVLNDVRPRSNAASCKLTIASI